MKVADMNKRQKKAFYNIKYAANNLLGGLENDLCDYPENSEEYKTAKRLLNDHNGLVKAFTKWQRVKYMMRVFAVLGKPIKCLYVI